MQKPLLSVCIITYNHAKYIRECIDSILEQQLTVPWEIVIADDHSTDGTREIIQEYQKKYPDLIRLILQKKNVGAEQNWLDLLANPKSKYLLYAEGDDFFTDLSKLQTQVAFLESHSEYSICFHPVRIMYEDGSVPDEIYPTPDMQAKKQFTIQALLAHNFMQTNSVMYRWRFANQDVRNILPRNIAPGDWYLHLLHAQVGKIGYIERVMAVYRRHEGGVMWNAHADLDRLWTNQGIKYLGMFWEALKLCGSNSAQRKVVLRQIYDMFERFMDLDGRKSTKLLVQAAQIYPEALQYYATELRHAMHREIDEAHELQVLRSRLAESEAKVESYAHELRSLKNSKFWKMRNRGAVIVGKKPIR
ncbi:MAG: glycosyltransferase [Cytophaga sp.]|nr:glycosyltransferase [Undibacterium sp.]